MELQLAPWAAVRQRITIGANAVIGAGVVVKGVADNSVIIGTPPTIEIIKQHSKRFHEESISDRWCRIYWLCTHKDSARQRLPCSGR